MALLRLTTPKPCHAWSCRNVLCDVTQTPRLVLTLHNMDNSGECSQEEFCYSGAPFDLQGST